VTAPRRAARRSSNPTAGVVRIKRAYAAQARSDGKRILVDRLWPRGLSKEKAAIDAWMKEIAPGALDETRNDAVVLAAVVRARMRRSTTTTRDNARHR
jgi:uncharacterized protein YeaO (DUF488 family)